MIIFSLLLLQKETYWMEQTENKVATDEIEPDQNISSLENQLSKLEQLVVGNNRQYEIHLKNEIDEVEEQKHMTATLRAKSRMSSPDSMPKLNPVTKRADTTSPK